jgi:SAM-dependent methyltransferase
MNLAHRWLCHSSLWRRAVEAKLPWAMQGVDLGAEVLEIGPGLGATTAVLIDPARRLTCVEIDGRLAHSLAIRFAGRNVRVIQNDAASMPLLDCSFDTAVCFTMLYHVASATLQDCVLKEVFRVLRPGGMFAGADSLDGFLFRLLHIGDTMIVVDPVTFPQRLALTGFGDIHVETCKRAFRFAARDRSFRYNHPPVSDSRSIVCSTYSRQTQCMEMHSSAYREVVAGWTGLLFSMQYRTLSGIMRVRSELLDAFVRGSTHIQRSLTRSAGLLTSHRSRCAVEPVVFRSRFHPILSPTTVRRRSTTRLPFWRR